jgi:signal transduction histidine kinase/ActR/RegA family two-component response regulator
VLSYGVRTEVSEEGTPMMHVVGCAEASRESPMRDDERERLHRRARRQARLLRESRAHQARLEQLLDVCHELARTHAREEILLQRVAERGAELLAADAVGVLLADEARLVLRGWAGVAAALFGESRPAEVRDCLAAAVKTSEAVVVPDVGGARAVVGLPLRAGWRVIGVLALARSAALPFSGDDVAIVTKFAAHAATALENARLYREVREADRRKDDFLARLGHELRNPLAPIVNALHLLERVGERGPQGPQLRAIMTRQIRNLAGLVDDLLDVSRIRLGKLALQTQPIDLRDVARRSFEALQLSRDAEGHDVALDVGTEPVVVMGDAARLEQVVGNLLHNAVKYTPRGAPIRLTVEPAAGEAVLCVRDRGIGIDPEMLPHVFQLFTQADRSLHRAQGGLGLGLALVRALVERHGGTVTGASAGLGHGSQFTVRLPLCTQAPEPAAGDGQERPTRPSRILLVEDNPDAREALRGVFEMEGHWVAVAVDGLAAIELAATFQPEFAFIDLGLPGVDGFEVARRLRAAPGARPMCLVALTGYGQPEDRRRTQEAGFDSHLVKPVLPEQLFEIIARTQAAAPGARPAG